MDVHMQSTAHVSVFRLPFSGAFCKRGKLQHQILLFVKLAVKLWLWSLQALSPEQGQTFLDVGSGTGYLTMVAANLEGHSGKAVGLEECLHAHCLLLLNTQVLTQHCLNRTLYAQSRQQSC